MATRLRLPACLGLICLSWLTGCVTLQEHTIECRNNRLACLAWMRTRIQCGPPALPWGARKHYACGYRTGYYDVASGADGTVPLFPPDCYWGPWFMNPRGYEEVQAWFSGYQDGASTALADGVQRWNTIPTSVTPNFYAGLAPQPGTPTMPPLIPGESLPPGSFPVPGEPVPPGAFDPGPRPVGQEIVPGDGSAEVPLPMEAAPPGASAAPAAAPTPIPNDPS